MKDYAMKTERLTFESLNPAMANRMYEIWGNDEVIKYTNFAKATDRDECAGWITRLIELHNNGELRLGPYTILREGTIIGLVGCQIQNRRLGECELWYLLDKPFWGQGYCFEAAHWAVGNAFADERVRLIWAEAVPENTASWKILEKLGMTREGRLRSRFRRDDMYWDLFKYSILREEWPVVRNSG